MLEWPPTWSRLLFLPALVVGFTVHELAHALVAYLLGDTGQVARKRLSLNPLRHISVPGTIAFLLLGLGWAKPVSVDPSRFRMRNQALGLFLVSISGSLCNLLVCLAALLAVSLTALIVGSTTGATWVEVLRYLSADDVALDLHGLVVALSSYMVTVNLLLGLFNLIPLPPLDGFNALLGLAGAVKEAQSRRRGRQREQPPAGAAQPAGDDRSPARIHFDIGLSYHRDGQLDEAIARYRQALGQDQGFFLAHYNLGLAYWAKGRPDLSAQAFKAAAQAPDVSLRREAGLRLRARAEAEPATGAPLPLTPLERLPSDTVLPAAPEVLDPAIRRRLWLRLLLGTAGFLGLAAAAWLFVTMTTLSAFAGG